MMQNTILPQLEPLGAEGLAIELRTEVATARTNNIPSVNSSVAAGGTLTLNQCRAPIIIIIIMKEV